MVVLPRRFMAFVLLVPVAVRAQNQFGTVPIVVAQAVPIQLGIFGMFGKPQYFDGRVPPGWPAELVPAGAKVLGGGVDGDSANFRMRTAVFAMSGNAKPDEVIRSLLVKSGFDASHAPPVAHVEGFAPSQAPAASAGMCNGNVSASFEIVDAAAASAVVVIRLLDGDGGKQFCTGRPSAGVAPHAEIMIPTMTPPAGVLSFGGGSSWGSNGGNAATTLRTTMAVDSILYHYTPQLVAAGWRAIGKPAVGDGAAVQRFAFREKDQNWEAALIVITVGDRREVRLEYVKAD